MRYMLLIHSDPEAMAGLPPEEYEKIGAEYLALTQSITESGELLANGPLAGTDTATTVRLQGGEPVPSDGPFVETKEYICGFYLVEVADLDRAIQIAGLVPGLPLGGVEVRPVLTMAEPETP